MLVEILMSTYNGERFLKEQIASILSQTHKDIRLLIQDDGSKDRTPEIIQEYAQLYPDKIIALPFKKNRGAMHSFEYLLTQSKAPYCMFADQDDVWLPQKVEHALQAIQQVEAESGADTPILAYSDLQVVDEHLKTIDSSFFHHSRITPQYLQTLPQLAVNNCVTGCTVMMNATARQVSLPFGAHAMMHDAWVALAVMAHQGQVILLPHADILYRQHGTNVLGSVALRYNFHYFMEKIMHVKKLIALQKALYAQANDVYQVSWPKFLWNRINYLIKR